MDSKTRENKMGNDLSFHFYQSLSEQKTHTNNFIYKLNYIVKKKKKERK